MAILAGGEVRQTGTPAEALGALEGRVWRKVVSKEEASHLGQEMRMLSSRLFAGRTEVRVLADAEPGPGFEGVNPDLSDVYFRTLKHADTADASQAA